MFVLYHVLLFLLVPSYWGGLDFFFFLDGIGRACCKLNKPLVGVLITFFYLFFYSFFPTAGQIKLPLPIS